MSEDTNATPAADPNAESGRTLAPHLVELFDPTTNAIHTTLRVNFDPSRHVRAEHKEAFLQWCKGEADWPPGSGGNVREKAVDPAEVTLPLPLSAPSKPDAAPEGSPSAQPAETSGAEAERGETAEESVQADASEPSDAGERRSRLFGR